METGQDEDLNMGERKGEEEEREGMLTDYYVLPSVFKVSCFALT